MQEIIVIALRSGYPLTNGTNNRATGRRSLAAMFTPAPPAFRLELEGWRAHEQPGVSMLDRDRLLNAMEGR